MSTQLPRSVYIHVPFCRHRCEYCNFTVVAGRDYLIEDYLRALGIELAAIRDRAVVDTVYLGGGTPSRLPPVALASLLGLIDENFELASQGEFTIEANPEDLPGEVGTVIADSRINRISLGVQSFDADKRKSLDRRHSDAQITAAIEFCLEHADSFSLDMIFAAPHDAPAIWEKDLRQAVASGAQHVSTYELTIEKGTLFWNRHLHGQLQAADDNRCAELYEQSVQRLCNAGLEHYEVSSFARPGHRSRHNHAYWSGQPYYAFGPGACGLVDGQRYTNHRSTSRYLKSVLSGGTAIEESQRLTQRDLALERVVFGLRMIDGVDLTGFQTGTGMELHEVVPLQLLDELRDQGLIEMTPDHLRLTHRGLLLGDLVCAKIYRP